MWYPDEEKGDIWEGKINMPLFWLKRYSFHELAEKMMRYSMRPIESDIINEIPCMVFKSSGYKSRRFKIWLPEQPPFYPVRVERYHIDILTYALQVQSLKNWDQVLFPEKMIYEIYQNSKETGERVVGKREFFTLLSFETNINIPDENFSHDFTPGSKVANHDTRIIYIADENSVLQDTGKRLIPNEKNKLINNKPVTKR